MKTQAQIIALLFAHGEEMPEVGDVLCRRDAFIDMLLRPEARYFATHSGHIVRIEGIDLLVEQTSLSQGFFLRGGAEPIENYFSAAPTYLGIEADIDAPGTFIKLR